MRFDLISDSHGQGDRSYAAGTTQIPFGPPTLASSRDYLWIAQFLSDQRLVYNRNASNGGETAAEEFYEIGRDLLKDEDRPDGVVIAFGTNDRNEAVAAGQSNKIAVPKFIAVYQELIRQAKAADVLPVIATIPPKGATETSWNSDVEVWNDEIRSLALRERVPCADFYRRLVDVSTGGMTVGGGYVPNLARDIQHPSSLGAWSMAEELVLVTNPYLPVHGRINDQLHNNTSATSNLIENGLMIDVGGVAGVADGWINGAPPFVPTVVAASGDGIPGFWQVLTSGGAAEGTITQPVPTTEWAPGETLRVSGVLKATLPAATFTSLLACHVQVAMAGIPLIILTPEIETTVLGGTVSLTIAPHKFEQDILIPAGAPNFQVQFFCSATAVAGAVGAIGQIRVVNLTRNGMQSRLARR